MGNVLDVLKRALKKTTAVIMAKRIADDAWKTTLGMPEKKKKGLTQESEL